MRENNLKALSAQHPIILASDEAYAMPLATTLRSIVESNQLDWPLNFHILSDGISEDTRNKIINSLPSSAASITWHEVDLELFQEFSTISYISKITYARFLIPTLFPPETQKVLYLDTDILVLDSLCLIWEINLGNNVLSAVLDGIDTKLKSDDPCTKGMPVVENYFNAGVLLINLTNWRQAQVSEKALEYLKQNPKSPYSDQDALNFACNGCWQQMDNRWNFHHRHFDIKLADMRPDEKPGIVHFVTSLKPWKPSSQSINADFYDAFRNRTCYARTPIDRLSDKIEKYCYRLKETLKVILNHVL